MDIDCELYYSDEMKVGKAVLLLRAIFCITENPFQIQQLFSDKECDGPAGPARNNRSSWYHPDLRVICELFLRSKGRSGFSSWIGKKS
jgi:hypothetical protein